MDLDELTSQILATWRRHNEILVYLLDEIPSAGLAAKPTGSRGRDVARQFAHLSRTRLGWLHFHETGERPKLPRYHKGKLPTKTQLRKGLQDSGKWVEDYLVRALAGESQPRRFGNQVVRWMGYLIAHESHHRGQIMVALKQSGYRLPEKVSVQGLWGKWIFGK